MLARRGRGCHSRIYRSRVYHRTTICALLGMIRSPIARGLRRSLGRGRPMKQNQRQRATARPTARHRKTALYPARAACRSISRSITARP